jgi:hypothetical protein
MPRGFIMPSTDGERLRLLADIKAMCGRVLGHPVRQANVDGWGAQDIYTLRRTHAAWSDTISRRKEGAQPPPPPKMF